MFVLPSNVPERIATINFLSRVQLLTLKNNRFPRVYASELCIGRYYSRKLF